MAESTKLSKAERIGLGTYTTGSPIIFRPGQTPSRAMSFWTASCTFRFRQCGLVSQTWHTKLPAMCNRTDLETPVVDAD